MWEKRDNTAKTQNCITRRKKLDLVMISQFVNLKNVICVQKSFEKVAICVKSRLKKLEVVMEVLTARFKHEPTDAEVYRAINKRYDIKRINGTWLYRLAIDDFIGGVIRVYKIGVSDRHNELERKIKKQHDKLVEWASSHGCTVNVARFVSCPDCHSKINTTAYKENCLQAGWSCPVCGHSLESMTYNKNIARRKAKLDALMEKYKAAEVDSYYYLAVCHFPNNSVDKANKMVYNIGVGGDKR